MKNCVKDHVPNEELLESVKNMNKEEIDILDTMFLNTNEYFTSTKVVNDILDLLPKSVWSNPELKFLNPSCKNGVFLREIAKRLFVRLKKSIPDDKERRKQIFTRMLYGLALTKIGFLMTKKTLYYAKTEDYGIFKEINKGLKKNDIDYFKGNIYYKDNSNHEFKGDKCIECKCEKKSIEKQKGYTNENHAYSFLHIKQMEVLIMKKFDVIIGNPPYRLGDTTIYQKFIEKAFDLKPRHACFIIPARWFVGSKKYLGDFKELMLLRKGKNIKTMVFEENGKSIFSIPDIKGGICYFHYDSNHVGDTKLITKKNGKIKKIEYISLEKHYNHYGGLITYGTTIINKIRKINKLGYFSENVFPQNSFAVRSYFKDFKKDKTDNYVTRIKYLKNIGYIQKKDYRDKHGIIDKYKLLLSKATGQGPIRRIKQRSCIINPGEICSETYLVLFVSNSLEIVKNVREYIDTKFFLYLLHVVKITQNQAIDTFRLIPNLDFTRKWSDIQLYKKFCLSTEEIEEIENIIE